MKRILYVAALCGTLMLAGCVPWWHGHGGYDHHGHDDHGGYHGHDDHDGH